MPLKDGIPSYREMAASLLETRVLMLTASNKHCATVATLNAGAIGYMRSIWAKRCCAVQGCQWRRDIGPLERRDRVPLT